MSTETIRRCDACRAEIPATAKVYEFRGMLMLHNGTTRQAETSRECCSQGCVSVTVSELMRTVSGPAICRCGDLDPALRPCEPCESRRGA